MNTSPNIKRQNCFVNQWTGVECDPCSDRDLCREFCKGIREIFEDRYPDLEPCRKCRMIEECWKEE